MIQLGERVEVVVKTTLYDESFIEGVVDGLGFVNSKPDTFWFTIAGLTSRFYSDEVEVNVLTFGLPSVIAQKKSDATLRSVPSWVGKGEN